MSPKKPASPAGVSTATGISCSITAPLEVNSETR